MCVHMRVYVQARGHFQLSSSVAILIDPGAHCLAGPVSPRDPPVSISPVLGLQGRATTSWVLGLESCLHGKHFAHRATVPAPKSSLFWLFVCFSAMLGCAGKVHYTPALRPFF